MYWPFLPTWVCAAKCIMVSICSSSKTKFTKSDEQMLPYNHNKMGVHYHRKVHLAIDGDGFRSQISYGCPGGSVMCKTRRKRRGVLYEE